MKVKASARVLIEIQDLGTWGEDCTVAQIKKQAEDAVWSRLGRVFDNGSGIRAISQSDIKIEVTE